MLFAHQPAHVREEESSLGVGRIGICVAVLVMDSMVANPLDDVVLNANCLHDHEQHLKLHVGLKASMRPETMSTDWNAKATNKSKNKF